MKTPPPTQTSFWAHSFEKALDILEARIDGLKEEEVEARHEQFGSNEIPKQHRLSRLRIVFNQLKSPLIIILLVAGVVTLFLQEWMDAGMIFATVLANTALGYWQENKAETVLEELRSYIHARVRVRREGQEHDIDAHELVPGDIIHISQGDRVPADGLLFHTNALRIDESVLTGESLPVHKQEGVLGKETALAERTNMLWSGTLVNEGYGEMLVTATNGNTEFGKIATLASQHEDEQTPLQKAVGRFAQLAGIAILLLAALLFGAGFALGRNPFEMFFISVAIAVSAVPEGMPIALTVILAIGVERLARKKGIVKKLLAAETLGSTSLVLTDKTGTLTEANMKLIEALPSAGKTDKATHHLLKEAVLTTDVVVENPDEEPDEWHVIGRAMEGALVQGAGRKGAQLPKILQETTITDRIPFNSKQKYSAVIARTGDTYQLLVLGAPEILLGFTVLGEKEQKNIFEEIDRRARSGERLLGVLSKTVDAKTELGAHVSHDEFSFEGLLVFRDPIRKGVKEAIERIGKAGVKTVIVTGDHRGTAEHVARELGILHGRGLVLTGKDMEKMDETALRKILPEVRVFARMTPEQKLKLVQMYRLEEEIVAVTGDGVNDAPALKFADVGVAVGSGTEVAKGAADLVILDNNFATIVEAIEEGRGILDNIRKTLVYLLSDSVDEILLIGGALLFSVPIPLSALQILFINFFSDSFPATGLAFEHMRDSTKRPKGKGSSLILTHEVKFLVFVVGTGTSTSLFAMYYFLLHMGYPLDLIRTFIFATFATYTLFVAFSARSLKRSIFTYNPFGNLYVIGGVAIGVFLTLCAVYIPFFQHILGTIPLPLPWLAGVFAVGLLNILVIEFGKFLYRNADE